MNSVFLRDKANDFLNIDFFCMLGLSVAPKQINPPAQRQIYPAYYWWWLMNMAKPESEEFDEDDIMCDNCSPHCDVKQNNKMLKKVLYLIV